MEAFKNPLTPEEEKKYIALCLSGDKAARSILIEYNLRLVAHISRKYNSAVRDPEDLLSIGTIGLIKAIDSYKPDKGCKLSGYAAKCIENELLMTLRHEKKKAREVSIYDPIGTDKEGNEIVILDIIGERQRSGQNDTGRPPVPASLLHIIAPLIQGEGDHMYALRS